MKKTDFEAVYKVCPVCSEPAKCLGPAQYGCSLRPGHFSYVVSGENIAEYQIYFDKFVSLLYRKKEIVLTRKLRDKPNMVLRLACDDPSPWAREPEILFNKIEKLLLLK